MRLRILAALFAASLGSVAPLAAAASDPAEPQPVYPTTTPAEDKAPPVPKGFSTDKGIWKAYVPKDVHGEFGGYDPIGLVAGQLIKADCSLNWRDQDGKLYCFSTGTSLVYFERWPQTYIRKARKNYRELTAAKPGS